MSSFFEFTKGFTILRERERERESSSRIQRTCLPLGVPFNRNTTRSFPQTLCSFKKTQTEFGRRALGNAPQPRTTRPSPRLAARRLKKGFSLSLSLSLSCGFIHSRGRVFFVFLLLRKGDRECAVSSPYIHTYGTVQRTPNVTG